MGGSKTLTGGYSVYSKTFEGENFRGFLAFRKSFTAFRESFTAIFFCVNGGSYGTTGKTRSFSSEGRFCLAIVKVFPLESFAVYGISYNRVDN